MSEDRKMYKCTCSDCKKETEVPFEPAADRPVYCKECYQKNQQKNQQK
jgi:CxxC-x17-CxxC domain-containing protein